MRGRTFSYWLLYFSLNILLFYLHETALYLVAIVECLAWANGSAKQLSILDFLELVFPVLVVLGFY